MSLKTLLLVSPFTDINSPYASSAYLSGFLKDRGYPVAQADLSIELFTRLFSEEGLNRIHEHLSRLYMDSDAAPKEIRYFLNHSDELIRSTTNALRFLQGKEPGLSSRLSKESSFPAIPGITDSWWASEQVVSHAKGENVFSHLETRERARYLATRHIYSMTSLLSAEPSLRLELMLYPTIKGYPQFKLEMISFDGFRKHLEAPSSVTEEMLDELVETHLLAERPQLVGISAPFTSTAYGAFRIARKIRKIMPDVKIVLGGGFASTELRELSDARVFDYFDYITLDDGETPILRLLDHLSGKIPADGLLRTFVRENGRVVLKSDKTQHDVPRKDAGTPSYSGLPLSDYVPVLESTYPCATRNFQNFRMVKMTLAQGCYWKKCTFCDVSLAYIDRYDPSNAEVLVDQIEKIMRETGENSFHFVDEAMPPKLIRALCTKLLEREVSIRWLGMMRFDNAFDPALASLMAKAGCVAVFCGLEVASERMFKIVDKGVTLEQVARVSRALANAGLMVHAYLMYGYPMQRAQDTVDSIEFVRQLFENGCIHSGVWSRFSLTAHSPIGLAPDKYGIRILPEARESRQGPRFCKNALVFEELSRDIEPEKLESGLNRSLRFFMHGVGFDRDVRDWFEDLKLPKPTLAGDFVSLAIYGKSKSVSK